MTSWVMDFDWQAWKWRSPSLTWLCNFYFQSSEICLKLGENAAWLQVKYKFLKPKGHRNHTPIRDNLSCVLTERFFQRDSLMNIVCFLAYCGCRCFPPPTPQPKTFPWKIDISRDKKWHVAAMEGSKSSSHSIWVCILHTLQWSLAQVTWHPELELLQSGKGSIFYIFYCKYCNTTAAKEERVHNAVHKSGQSLGPGLAEQKWVQLETSKKGRISSFPGFWPLGG